MEFFYFNIQNNKKKKKKKKTYEDIIKITNSNDVWAGWLSYFPYFN